jgi:hypothetical protein
MSTLSLLTRAGAAALLASTTLSVAFGAALTMSPQPHRQEIALLRPVSHRYRSAMQRSHLPVARTVRNSTPARNIQPARVIARAPSVAPQSISSSHAPPFDRSSSNGSFSIQAQPWRLTADGVWATIVVSSFVNAAGERQPNLRAHVTFDAPSAEVVELDPWIEQGPSAAILASGGQNVTVTASALEPAAGSATLTLPAPPNDLGTFASVAQPIGPHLVAIGWTPLDASAGVREYKIFRRESGADHDTLVGVVSPAGHSWRDARVAASSSYEYSVVADVADGSVTSRAAQVSTPGDMPDTSLAALSGKGMFLFFSPDTNDRNSYAQFDPDGVISRASRAGISEIELRLSRGTFFEAATPESNAWLNRLIDTAATAGIKLIAWSVPRRNTVEDVAQSVAMARYRTPAGNGFAGLALDLEPGDNYMGYGDIARARMGDYMEMTRAAVGPDYLLVATVMSPRLTGWTNDQYPYSRIARYASVMQPMEYWHHFRGAHDYMQADVSGACADAVSMTRTLAGRNVPVNVAGQSSDLGLTGAPAPDELASCLGGAKAAGALGETFFAWQGTAADQWAAIEAYRW